MDPAPRFRDAEAKRILDRAAEIDAQERQHLDANALREIAAEAGISPASVDRALAEHHRALAEQHTPPPPSLGARLMRRPVLVISLLAAAAYVLARLFP
jgi:hypothetical protein